MYSPCVGPCKNRRETKARRGDGEYGRLYEGAEGHDDSRGTGLIRVGLGDDDVDYYVGFMPD